MDKFWSIMTFPIGVLICFGPALILWVREELRDPPPDDHEEPR